MLALKNDQLSIEIVDPRQDRHFLGTRYCSGGYIAQVTDSRRGKLLAGPTYPAALDVFHGQGIPDSFNLRPLKGDNGDDRALVLGVGLCDLVSRTVRQPCRWQIAQDGDSAIGFTTRHVFQGWRIELERRVTLLGRTLRSETMVRNVGADYFPMVWFPHPFFPQPPAGRDELIKLNIDLEIPENNAYELSPSGFILRKGWPWTEGHHQIVSLRSAEEAIVVIQRHPVLGRISAVCSYMPSSFPIWGNQNTFSWEPMIDRAIAPAESTRWQIDYNF